MASQVIERQMAEHRIIKDLSTHGAFQNTNYIFVMATDALHAPRRGGVLGWAHGTHTTPHAILAQVAAQ